MRTPWIPERGDLVWINFSPQAGHEQAGLRPALTLSPSYYNRNSGLALFCPITSRRKGYPFEVDIPAGLRIQGVIQADQIRSIDWRARKAKLAGRASPATVAETLAKASALLS